MLQGALNAVSYNFYLSIYLYGLTELSPIKIEFFSLLWMLLHDKREIEDEAWCTARLYLDLTWPGRATRAINKLNWR